jgi:hypothetical protein
VRFGSIKNMNLNIQNLAQESTKYARLGYVLIAYASSSLEDSMRA